MLAWLHHPVALVGAMARIVVVVSPMVAVVGSTIVMTDCGAGGTDGAQQVRRSEEISNVLICVPR
jgi:hypothetical protein